MTEWENPSALRGGDVWFKAADFQGQLVMLQGFAAAGHDHWGNEYAKGVILVADAPDGPVVFTPATGGELKGNLMSIALKGNVIGRLSQGEAKGGNNAPWILEDADEAEQLAAKATWVKLLEQDSAGHWRPKVDPDTAPF